MNWVKYERTTPNWINSAVKAPILPDISIGKIYFIINGINVLNNPEHIPENNLTIRSNIKFGIKAKRPTINAAIIVINRHFLIYFKKVPSWYKFYK